tara:strand:+ start:916 stop:1137 length:222 start_codon:yes stop_codon:yes gene_type:complete
MKNPTPSIWQWVYYILEVTSLHDVALHDDKNICFEVVIALFLFPTLRAMLKMHLNGLKTDNYLSFDACVRLRT